MHFGNLPSKMVCVWDDEWNCVVTFRFSGALWRKYKYFVVICHIKIIRHFGRRRWRPTMPHVYLFANYKMWYEESVPPSRRNGFSLDIPSHKYCACDWQISDIHRSTTTDCQLCVLELISCHQTDKRDDEMLYNRLEITAATLNNRRIALLLVSSLAKFREQ